MGSYGGCLHPLLKLVPGQWRWRSMCRDDGSEIWCSTCWTHFWSSGGRYPCVLYN